MANKPQSQSQSLIARFAERFGVDPAKVLETLKATAFKQRDGSAPTNEQMMALLIVAEQYGLNPFTREIYAFPDRVNGIIPVVGVDGWSRIINEHPQFDGIEFVESPDSVPVEQTGKSCPTWIECIIYRKDRRHPIKIREYFDEVYRPPFTKNGQTIDGPWQSHPKRMLRHKSMIQCSRVAFGFTGIYDQDEAERIVDMGVAQRVDQPQINTVTTPGTTGTVQQIAHEVVDPMVDQLIKRASAAGAWVAARDYVETRLKGADLEYALNRLSEAEAELGGNKEVEAEAPKPVGEPNQPAQAFY